MTPQVCPPSVSVLAPETELLTSECGGELLDDLFALALGLGLAPLMGL